MSKFRFEGSKAYFDYSGLGKDTNESYMGEFCVKTIISPLDSIKIDRLYRELLGSINPHLASDATQNYAFALSQLKYRVLEMPEFFKNKELDGGHLDASVLVEIINLAIEAEEEYKNEQEKKIQQIQAMLASKIKKKEIVKQEEEEIHEISNPSDLENIPEIDLE